MKRYDPPMWHDVRPFFMWSVLYFLTTMWFVLEPMVFQYLATVMGMMGRMIFGRKPRGASRGLIARGSVALKVFRDNVAYLRGTEPAIFRYLTFIRSVSSVIICVLYVYVTYLKNVTPIIHMTQLSFGIALLVTHLLTIWTNDAPVAVVFSLDNIFECLTIPSLILAKDHVWLNLNFFRAYNVLLSYNDLEKFFNIGSKQVVSKRVYVLILQAVVYCYIVACGLQFFELLDDPTERITPGTFYLTFVNTLYFTTVTIFTVGYGDFVPKTMFGRLWIVGIVITGAYIVSVSVSQAVKAISESRRGEGKYIRMPNVKHIVVCGTVRWEYLKQFLLEFYAEEANRRYRVVVICNEPDWTTEVWTRFTSSLTIPPSNVKYFNGSTQTTRGLWSGDVMHAEAVFVLARPHSANPESEDSEITKHILSIRNHNHCVPIYAMCVLRDTVCAIRDVLEPRTVTQNSNNRSDFESSNDESSVDSDYERPGASQRLLCMQYIETYLMSENIFCNGISTLIVNALSRSHPSFCDADRPWLHEYKLGAECDLHLMHLPQNFVRRKYKDIAVTLYDHGILILSTRKGTGDWISCTDKTVFIAGMEGVFLTYYEEASLIRVLKGIAEDLGPLEIEPILHDSSEKKGTKHVLLDLKSDRRRGSSSSVGRHSRSKELRNSFDLCGELNQSHSDNEGKEKDDGVPYSVHSPRHSLLRNMNKHKKGKHQLHGFRGSFDIGDLQSSWSPRLQHVQRDLQPLQHSPEEQELCIYRRCKLPVHLSRHLIVFMMGNVALLHLERFLKKIWQKRCGHKRLLPVVAVHEQFPENFEQELSRYAGHLFLLEGRCQSVDILHKAQLKAASSVVVLAMEEWTNREELDSKALFTVMTLDNTLPENSDVYVCTVVDAEESIQLLRAPHRPRRKGVRLGDIHHPVIIAKRENEPEEELHTFHEFEDRFDSVPSSDATTSFRTRSTSIRPANTFFDSLSNARRLFTVNFRHDHIKGRESRRRKSDNKQFVKKYRKADKVMEWQRLASGEVYINTHVVTLMVRDFVKPGIIDFLGRIDGVDGSFDMQVTATPWWRLISIPNAWIEDRSVPERTYRDAFVRLASIGVFPFGVYRSGDAPVRILVDSEVKKRSRVATKYDDSHLRDFRTGSSDFRGSTRTRERRHQTYSGSWTLDEEMRQLLGEPTGLKSFQCPETNRVCNYREVLDGENMLPYVYTNPEPYTVLASTDAIFVQCHPDYQIPPSW